MHRKFAESALINVSSLCMITSKLYTSSWRRHDDERDKREKKRRIRRKGEGDKRQGEGTVSGGGCS